MIMKNFPIEVITESTGETEGIGRVLAKLICEDTDVPRFVAMYGDLGVGKTAFVRGFCSELCPGVTVKSPTFAIVNEYRCSLDTAEIKKVCHFDMYRVTDEDDLYSIGFDDYLVESNICILEWCEMIPYALPDEYVEVRIEKLDLNSKRKITIGLVI